MAGPVIHDSDRLVRYAKNDLPPDDTAQTEQHIRECAACQDFVAFLRGFDASLAGVVPREVSAGEPHPDPALIVALASDEVDEETAQHLRAHLLFCKDCMEEFYALRRAHADEKQSGWQRLLESIKDLVIDLGRLYGPGTLIGPIRIVEESPAFALRLAGAERLFKTVELSVGDNRYRVEVGLTADGPMDCNIDGTSTPSKVPLMVTVHSETGEILRATETTAEGKGSFTLSESNLPRELCVLMFNLENRSNHLVFRMPEDVSARE